MDHDSLRCLRSRGFTPRDQQESPPCSSRVATTPARRQTVPHHIRRSFEVRHHEHTASDGPPRTYKRGLAGDSATGQQHLRIQASTTAWVRTLRGTSRSVSDHKGRLGAKGSSVDPVVPQLRGSNDDLAALPDTPWEPRSWVKGPVRAAAQRGEPLHPPLHGHMVNSAAPCIVHHVGSVGIACRNLAPCIARAKTGNDRSTISSVAVNEIRK